MRDVVITHGVRTPIGKVGQSLKDIDDTALGMLVVRELLRDRAKLGPDMVEHVIFGEVKQSSDPANLARVVALEAGITERAPAYTVHRQCGSGLQAIADAFSLIRAGEAEVVVAGGVENMSQSAYFMRKTAGGLGSGNYTIEDSLVAGGPGAIPAELYGSHPMGITAEKLADIYHISRAEQDEFAQRSQERIARAMAEGRFDAQLVPVPLPQGGALERDEHPRLGTVEKLAALPPAFRKDGSVTAGNSSGRNDGGAAVLVMEAERAKELGYTPMARVIAVGTSGCDPTIMGIAPVESTRRALEKAGLTLHDIDVVELNEAFAAQSLAVLREWEGWGVSREELLQKVNPNGGAIAHGHPLGCTGAALTVKCIYELERVPSHRYGLITLCCAGGVGIALIVEKWKEVRV